MIEQATLEPDGLARLFEIIDQSISKAEAMIDQPGQALIELGIARQIMATGRKFTKEIVKSQQTTI